MSKLNLKLKKKLENTLSYAIMKVLNALRH